MQLVKTHTIPLQATIICFPHIWLPFNARILVLGFIRAESAVIGLLKGCVGILMSIITTLFCGEVSPTQMYLSDSIVTCVKVICCWLIPTLGSCKIAYFRKLTSRFFSHMSQIEKLCPLHENELNTSWCIILFYTDLKVQYPENHHNELITRSSSSVC